MAFLAHDSVELIKDGKPRITNDGYMVASARAARTGVQTYLGSELGRDDMSQVRVYRPKSSVFDRKSLESYAHKPVTNDHPPVSVDSTNHKQYSVGHIGEDIVPEGSVVRVPLMLADQAAIDDFNGGKVEVSMGYSMDLDWTSGKIEDTGEEYDAIQRNIRINHIALVDRGRAGPSVRIGDSWQPIETNSNRRKASKSKPTIGDQSVDLKTMVVDGIGSVETTDSGIQAITKLQDANKQTVKDAAKAAKDAKTAHDNEIETLKSEHKEAIAAKDKSLGEKDGEIKTLKDAAMTPEKVDALVADRSALIGKATQIIKDGDFKGKSDAEIKAMCVDSHYGDNTAKDQSDDYVAGMFGAIKVSNDSFADAMHTRAPVVAFDNASGKSESQLAYEQNLTDGWQNAGSIEGSK